MAKIRQRTWRVRGQRTKRKAWGFVTVKNGNQVRCVKAEWTKEDAENALAARLLKIDQEPKVKAAGLTLAQAAERGTQDQVGEGARGPDTLARRAGPR